LAGLHAFYPDKAAGRTGFSVNKYRGDFIENFRIVFLMGRRFGKMNRLPPHFKVCYSSQVVPNDNMRLFYGLILLAAIWSCNPTITAIKSDSPWESMADDFHYKNLTEFSLDTSLLNSYYGRQKVYDDFIKPKDRTLDDILLTKHYYLYSWQQYDTCFTAFTLLKEGRGEALEMHYLIFNGLNKLVSDVVVAKHGGEPGGYQYETKSYLKSKDTIISTEERTFFVDQKTLKQLSQPVGDTVHFKQIISNNGTIQIETIDSIFISQNFVDEDGWITQKMIDKYYKRKKH